MVLDHPSRPTAAPVEPPLWQQPAWFGWRALTVVWTVMVSFFVAQYALQRFYLEAPLDLRDVTYTVVEGYLWVPLTYLVLRLAVRFPVEREPARRHLVLHLAFAFAIFALDVLLSAGARIVVYQPGPFGPLELLTGVAVSDLVEDLLIYTIIVAVVHAFGYYTRYRERALQALALDHQLTQARLQALRMQLHPHFLFNTLNTIALLVRRDRKGEAVDTITALGDLLRNTLHSEDACVPLRQELDLLRAYLGIERVRFGDQLDVRWDVAPDVLGAFVPNLMLQPLVENALKHGLAQQEEPGVLEISAQRVGPMLCLRVRDTGAGLPEQDGHPVVRRGIGLQNTVERLHQLYGTDFAFDLRNHPAGGAVVDVALPYQTHRPAAAA